MFSANSPFRPSRFVPIVAASGALLLASGVLAQGGHRAMVFEGSDGPNYFRVSLPDIRALRTPDYLRNDLPDFDRTLALDTAQQETVSRLIEDYLAAFELLATEHLPAGGPMMMVGEHDDHGPGGHEAHPDDAGFNVFFGGGGVGDPQVWDMQMDGPGMVAITIEAGGPGGGGAGEDVDVTVGDGGSGPEASVSIAVKSADGEEMSEEDRKKLEERAQQIAEQIRARMEEMEEGGGNGLMVGSPLDPQSMEERMAELEEMTARAKTFEREKIRLRHRFEEQVQGGLEEAQVERWPALERTLTRKKTLPNGRLDGERTDLVRVLDDVAPEARDAPAVAERVDTYELMLHDALTRRNTVVKEANEKVDEAIGAGDIEKAAAIVERATRLRIAVRTINEEYGEAIARALDEAEAARFRDAVRETSYPRVYRQTAGLRIFEAARQLDGLAEERLLDILELEGQYRSEMDLVNDQIRRAIDAWEPGESRRQIERMAEINEGDVAILDLGADTNPVRAAFTRRDEVTGRYVRNLREMLTPEQAEALPRLPKRHRGPVFIERSTID